LAFALLLENEDSLSVLLGETPSDADIDPIRRQSIR
jgi:hypothetical protein